MIVLPEISSQSHIFLSPNLCSALPCFESADEDPSTRGKESGLSLSSHPHSKANPEVQSYKYDSPRTEPKFPKATDASFPVPCLLISDVPVALNKINMLLYSTIIYFYDFYLKETENNSTP